MQIYNLFKYAIQKKQKKSKLILKKPVHTLYNIHGQNQKALNTLAKIKKMLQYIDIIVYLHKNNQMDIKLVVYGNPKAQQRPRFTKSGHVFSPGGAEKKSFQLIIQENAPEIPTEKAVMIVAEFFFRRPKSHYGTGKNSDKLKPSAPKYHTGRKDLDNIYKFYTDAMNGIMYRDDGQIVFATISKVWTEKQERVEIEIYDDFDEWT